MSDHHTSMQIGWRYEWEWGMSMNANEEILPGNADAVYSYDSLDAS